MEILTASFGFCIGINRAYRGMNVRALKEAPFTVAHQNSKGEFDTLRRIDRREPELLNRYPGLDRISVAYDASKLDEGDRLVLGFHGFTQDAKDGLAARGVDVLDDLMCPFIAKLDRVVERLAGEGYDIAIVGMKDSHHCVTAQEFAEQHGRRCFVIERAVDIDLVPHQEGRAIALVGQVTGNTEIFNEVVERIRKSELQVKIVKTMCSDSYGRQKNAAELASKTDLVILVDDGGHASQSVFEVCSRVNPRVHRIRLKEDIKAEWLDGANKVAIIGGILIPEWTIEDVAQHLHAMCLQPA
jgi:4-hydroxy-3-methylbut-2-enyl diphosphate reductase